jgi:glycopeptide antibiotics resistance protein
VPSPGRALPPAYVEGSNPASLVGFLSLTRNIALLTSLGLIAAVTLTPTGGDRVIELSELGDLIEALRRSDEAFLLSSLLEAAANVLLFVPFGAALGLRGFSIGRTARFGFVLSVAVESAQWLLVPGRTTSLDDVLLNTLGAMLGHALLFRLLPVLR